MTATLVACTVRVRMGCVIFRHGRAWVPGELLAVTAADAVHLIERGLAIRA